MKSFKSFLESKQNKEQSKKDWKKEFIKLEKGFIPPSKMRPLIDAFQNSNTIKLIDDNSKDITMPKKSLFLTGGSVRDFLKNKTFKNFNLATDATPQQIVKILKNAGFTQSDSDSKYWLVSKRINGDPVSFLVYVSGEEFELSPFYDVEENVVKYTDDLLQDASKRDFTINSLYIDLSKSDGENNKLYDPTGHGWYDIMQGNIKTIDKAESKFKKDKITMMRALRFHSQYGKGEIPEDILNGIKELRADVSDLSSAEIREEFIKGLIHPDIDPKKYIRSYYKARLLEKVFPDLDFNIDIPSDFSSKKDKILALAWILQNNPIEKINDTLSMDNGWTEQEKRSISFLLKLKEFDEDNLDELLDYKKITPVTSDQIKNWVNMFDNKSGSKWSKLVRNFADFDPRLEDEERPDPLGVGKFIKKEKIKSLFKKHSKY